MSILNYTTKVPAQKSIGEIQSMLASHGATKIVLDYDSRGQPSGLAFAIAVDGKPIYFALPCQADGVLAAMQKDKKVSRSLCTQTHALSVAWRILKDWCAAQCAVIDARLVVIEQVFLPYAVTRSGETLYEHFKSGKSNLLLPENDDRPSNP